MIDPIQLGVLLHRSLEQFFTWVLSDGSDRSGALAVGRREEYRERLRAIVSKICRDYRRRNPALLDPIASEIGNRVEELIQAFLDVELSVMGEETVEGSEVRLSVEAPDIGAVLVGTIDRMSRNPEGYTLIDYKKKSVPARGDLLSSQLASLQMPFYIHLMKRLGRSVSKAAYYSFENRRYHFVFGGPKTNMMSPEDAYRSASEVTERIVEMRERVAAGDYRIGDRPAPSCMRCGLQGICRSGYSLNR
jgi:hypothetical protein